MTRIFIKDDNNDVDEKDHIEGWKSLRKGRMIPSFSWMTLKLKLLKFPFYQLSKFAIHWLPE